MSLHILKKKTQAIHTQRKYNSKQPLFWKPQFSNCCGKQGLGLGKGFSIHGSTRGNSYIGKTYEMRAPNTLPVVEESMHYIQPSVVNHSTLIRKRVRQNNTVVKAIDTGNKTGRKI